MPWLTKAQGRINHNTNKAKCLGPMRKMGPKNVKNEQKGPMKPKIEKSTLKQIPNVSIVNTCLRYCDEMALEFLN